MILLSLLFERFKILMFFRLYSFFGIEFVNLLFFNKNIFMFMVLINFGIFLESLLFRRLSILVFFNNVFGIFFVKLLLCRNNFIL